MKVRDIVIAGVLAILLSLSGCVSMFTAETTATYEVSPDGKKLIAYKSNKEQQGLTLDLEETDGKVKIVKISVDRAMTPEAAIAAALQVQTELLKQLIPILQKGAMGGS